MKDILKVGFLFLGILSLLPIALFIYLCSNPTDYAHIYKDYNKKIGNKYSIDLSKEDIISRMRPCTGYTEASNNIQDSLFVIYFTSQDPRIDLIAFARIIEESKNHSIIKFDSIIRYSFRGVYDESEMARIVQCYDSLAFVNQFKKNVILKIMNDSINSRDVYFDNRLAINDMNK